MEFGKQKELSYFLELKSSTRKGIVEMDSVRRVVRLCLGAVTVLSCACTVTHFIGATQNTLEQQIDQKFPTFYRQAAPDLPLGQAHCPAGLMKLDHGKVGRCTFDLGTVSIPIVVTLGPKNQLQYRADAFLFDIRRVAPYIQSNLLQSYGVRASVDCGDPRYRVLRSGARLSCRLKGEHLPRSVAVEVMDGGKLFIHDLPGLKSREAALTQPLIEQDKAGHAIIVSGETMEKIFETNLPALQAVSAQQHLRMSAVSCPPSVDLTGSKRAVCHFDVSGKNVRVVFWIKGNDWHMEALDVAFSKSWMEATAASYYRQLELNNGFTVKIAVHCNWPDALVLTPPASRDCVMTVDKDKRRLTIQVPTASGVLNYYVWPKPNG
jgi:hypothetical protein